MMDTAERLCFPSKMVDSTPLSSATLASLPAEVRPPDYDRAALQRSIVHIGVGGFHRAHLATYVDELCRAGHHEWGIVGSGVLDHDAAMAEALGAQDTLFTVIERGPSDTSTSIVGSMIDYIHAAPNPEPLIDAIAAPTTQIVSLTVTEGGYPVDDATGAFDPESPNASDGSAFALIVAGLQRRMLADGPPLSIVSCDNIMSNGDVTERVTLGLAAERNDDLPIWIETNVSFPNSMVDRITPATSDSDRAWLETTHQITDRWPVVCEPFRQWVIEDDFAGARPPFEDLDIILTDDVRPYEHMKLQLLNAGHSCLAYPGGLLAIEFVHDAMADPDILRFVEAYLNEEAKRSLHPVAGLDFDEYIAMLLERFANPNIGDQVARLCSDGSGKLPKFVLPTLRTNLANDGPIDKAAMLLASWCEYLRGIDHAGEPFEPAHDPLFDEVRAAADRSVADPAAFLAVEAVFDPDLAANDRLRTAFGQALDALRNEGVRSALQRYAGVASGGHGEDRSG